MVQANVRVRELGRIHILKKELALDDESYRNVLWTVCRVDSSKDLDAHGRLQLIRHLQSHAKKTKNFKARPHNAGARDRKELTKIEALLADARMPWSYAEAIMQRQTRGSKQRLEFCSPGELAGIIAALERAALKRLKTELAQTLAALGYNLDWAEHVATLLGVKASTHTLECSTQAMSELLRWLRGEVDVFCESPVNLDKPKCCAFCYEKAQAKALA
jgi:phage gp16-like protein